MSSGFTKGAGVLGRAKAMAIVTAATRPAHELPCAVHDAFDRIEKGEFDEPAVAAEASIEKLEVEGGAPPIMLFISDAEEAVAYTPEEARRLACDLLAMAEVSEAFSKMKGDLGAYLR